MPILYHSNMPPKAVSDVESPNVTHIQESERLVRAGRKTPAMELELCSKAMSEQPLACKLMMK